MSHRNGDALADRLPPQNMEAERGVIGSVLLDWDQMGEVGPALDPGDFYRDAHEILWRELRRFAADGLKCDALILRDRLEAMPAGPGKTMLDVVGGVDALADIQSSVPHAANAAYYAAIVRSKAIGRAVIEACHEAEREAYSGRFSGDTLLEAFEKKVFALADRRARASTVRVGELVPDFHDAVSRRTEGEVSGLTTGFFDLDDITLGLQPENLIYIAARTSVGKTTLALNIVEHQVIRWRRPGLFVSLEMSRAEVMERLAVARARVDGKRARTGTLDHGDLLKLRRAADEFLDAPLFIDGAPGQTVVHIAANARRLKAREGIQFVFVDLINHVVGEDQRQTKREQMAETSRRLKVLARELALPVVVMAQINRGPESRESEGHRPRMSDIKECGNIEEDADMVILVHRPNYNDPNADPREATLIVAKNRNGPTGDAPAVFLRHCARFDNVIPDAARETGTY